MPFAKIVQSEGPTLLEQFAQTRGTSPEPEPTELRIAWSWRCLDDPCGLPVVFEPTYKYTAGLFSPRLDAVANHFLHRAVGHHHLVALAVIAEVHFARIRHG